MTTFRDRFREAILKEIARFSNPNHPTVLFYKKILDNL